MKVGIVPIRPLDLGGLYGGAFAAIRANPAVMVGLTAIVVVLSQVVTFLAQIPLTTVSTDPKADDDASVALILGSSAASLGISLIAAIATLFLTGVLTVVVARSVLGEKTSIGEAARLVGPRLLPLIGLSVIQFLIFFVPMLLIFGAAIGMTIGGLGNTGMVVGTVLVAVLAFVLIVAGAIALMPAFSLSYQAVVLERLGPITALRRAWRLQEPGYWRLVGILLLTYVVTGIVAAIVAIPFGVGTALVESGDATRNLAGGTVVGLAIAAVGSAIGQVLTVPFTAGVQALLYIDQRMRNEGLDHALRAEAIHRWQTGTVGVPTENLWVSSGYPQQY
ncbi:hypothetical protein AXK60_05560 [Tsukamurella pseudospumae]|uniref:DUF7847 domain-containing protein n=1 Tax=Tsukamurella pseudospumae TaxID=239498 RepID=A0A138AJR0_9ACTN|nr:hypothetical protein AXK61_08250 [Tsukamurella pseudospumae]KXP10758.1 hypothetical protein AXK60_05560 [Tsukamurella pseudospumae]